MSDEVAHTAENDAPCPEASSWPFTVDDAPCARPAGHEPPHRTADGREWGHEPTRVIPPGEKEDA